MNNRGQAALEYLMTYGWALIVIAIVVGVLVFIVSSPAGAIVCNSDDPAKVMVKASQVDSSTGDGTIIITNLTGGDMSSMTIMVGSTGAFDFHDMNDTNSLTSGSQQSISVTGKHDSTAYSTTTIELTYNDYASLSRTATLTCSGPITTAGS